ncbi:MAG TPA: MerR family transcriptional regulator [Candidatus Kapabacteria bacterium]|nr:MerR family transcriptional regulator [Candidatus Kapabacteria bacterium]
MHSIQSVAERTGLTPDVIRIWERRYQAVAPDRTASNQRLYSDDDVERLALLKRVTDNGRRISIVANLSNDELRQMAAQVQVAPRTALPAVQVDPLALQEQALDAIQQLDPALFDQLLERAMVGMGSVGFMMRFAAPLMVTVGNLWRSGAVRTCQEHFASAHLRSFLGRYMLDANTDPLGPRIVIATLPGQAHELGATMAAVVAAQSGWNVLYLGANVPIEEIAFAADCKDARAVAVSLSYPLDDPRVPVLLKELRQKLPSSSTLIVGGIGSTRQQPLLDELKALQADDLVRLAEHLDRMR